MSDWKSDVERKLKARHNTGAKREAERRERDRIAEQTRLIEEKRAIAKDSKNIGAGLNATSAASQAISVKSRGLSAFSTIKAGGAGSRHDSIFDSIELMEGIQGQLTTNGSGKADCFR